MSKDFAAQRMEKIVSLCKRRGFIFQSSEIYGGLNGFWDYGPLGVELKRNLKDFWWRRNVREREDMVGMDGAIIMNRAVWKASGHEDTFSDPMVDCRSCKSRYRADQLPVKDGGNYCPNCGSRDLTEPRAFNLMFKSFVGPWKAMKTSFISAPKQPRRYSSSLKMSWKPRARSFLSASRRSERLSATKSIPEITPSAPASSSRWKSRPLPSRGGVAVDRLLARGTPQVLRGHRHSPSKNPCARHTR